MLLRKREDHCQHTSARLSLTMSETDEDMHDEIEEKHLRKRQLYAPYSLEFRLSLVPAS